MKVEVYTDNYFNEYDQQPRKLIFKGWLDAIPQIGERIRLNDHWASVYVLKVDYNLEGNCVDITIEADTTEEHKCLLDSNSTGNE